MALAINKRGSILDDRIKENSIQDCVLASYLIDSESRGLSAVIDQVFPLLKIFYYFYWRYTIERLQIVDFYRLTAAHPITIEKIKSDLIFLIFDHFHVDSHRLLAGNWIAGIKLANVPDWLVPSAWGWGALIFNRNR